VRTCRWEFGLSVVADNHDCRTTTTSELPSKDRTTVVAAVAVYRPATGPTYAINRPAQIAPNQQKSDAQASFFASFGSGPLSSAGLPNTFFCVRESTITPPNTSTSLTQKSQFAARVCASAQKSATPVTALSQKAPHNIGNIFS